MYNKVISVMRTLTPGGYAPENLEETFPKVEEALSEGYTVKEVISHQHGHIVSYVFVLEIAKP